MLALIQSKVISVQSNVTVNTLIPFFTHDIIFILIDFNYSWTIYSIFLYFLSIYFLQVLNNGLSSYLFGISHKYPFSC